MSFKIEENIENDEVQVNLEVIKAFNNHKEINKINILSNKNENENQDKTMNKRNENDFNIENINVDEIINKSLNEKNNKIQEKKK